MSSGTGRRMISLKKSSTQFDLAVPQHAAIGLALVPPKLRAAGDQRTHAGLLLLILVDQLDAATERAASSGCGDVRLPELPPLVP